MTTVSIDQNSFAFYNDGTEAGATIIGSVNVNPTLEVDTTYGCRFLVQNFGAATVNNLDLEFQYNKDGSWINITTTSAVIKAVDSASLTNAADCTQRIGAGTFFANNDGVTEDGISGGGNLDLPAAQECETLLAFQIVAADVADEDIIEIRLTRDGGTLITYTRTPAITVNEAGATQYPQAVDGVISPTGVVAALAQKAVAGTLTPDGTITANAIKARLPSRKSSTHRRSRPRPI